MTARISRRGLLGGGLVAGAAAAVPAVADAAPDPPDHTGTGLGLDAG